MIKKRFTEKGYESRFIQHSIDISIRNIINPNHFSNMGKTTQKKYPNIKQNLIAYNKKHPEQCKNAGKISYNKNRRLAIEKGIHMATKMKRSSKQEQILKKLLPNDFLHNLRFGNAIPDFRSKKRKIIIQVDGNWHNIPKVKERDEKQEEIWMNEGYSIFRFNYYDVNKYLKPMVIENA